jgi:hypothetical protein
LAGQTWARCRVVARAFTINSGLSDVTRASRSDRTGPCCRQTSTLRAGFVRAGVLRARCKSGAGAIMRAGYCRLEHTDQIRFPGPLLAASSLLLHDDGEAPMAARKEEEEKKKEEEKAVSGPGSWIFGGRRLCLHSTTGKSLVTRQAALRFFGVTAFMRRSPAASNWICWEQLSLRSRLRTVPSTCWHAHHSYPPLPCSMRAVEAVPRDALWLVCGRALVDPELAHGRILGTRAVEVGYRTDR